MIALLEQAKTYLATLVGLSDTDQRALWRNTPPEVRYKANRLEMEKHFTEDKRDPDRRKIHTSPSGKYTLTVDSYTTSKGSWNYTRGRVFLAEQDGDEPIADVKRNYGGFGFTWMEDHGAHGDDYLVCGEDYQGQTFINLTTGFRRNLQSDGSEKGWGFCWVSYELMPDGVTMKVEGCHWACPYEYRFFDVSDPVEKGWPQLGLPEGIDCLDEGERTTLDYEDGVFVWRESDLVFKATGERYTAIERTSYDIIGKEHKAKHMGDPQAVIDAYKAEYEAHEDKYPDEEDEPELWERVHDHIIRFRNEGGTLVLVSEWKSDYQLEAERRWEEGRAKSVACRQTWREEDELCQALEADLGDLGGLVNFMYPSQVSRWDGEKNTAYFQVSGQKYDPDKSNDHSVKLAWGVQEGPVTVALWIRGKGDVSKPEFPRTPAGVLEAWKAGQKHLAAEPKGV